MKKITLQLTNSMNRSHVWLGFLLIPLAWLALSPQARATCQEGCLTNSNTVLGDDALISNTGGQNTAVGFNALFSNTSGSVNTAVGSWALYANTTSTENTAIGFDALQQNTTGSFNTATGGEALKQNTTGGNNTADGYYALRDNTIGFGNVAIGYACLVNNDTGVYNIAVGYDALLSNDTGGSNIAVGTLALWQNASGYNNIAIGNNAGGSALSGSDNIFIGNRGEPDDSRVIKIGSRGIERTFIGGINNSPVGDGAAVVVSPNGRLGILTSSARFKDSIKPMDKASEAILALKPVSFRYKHELDPKGVPQFGLVAEEVEKVNPDLVARDEQGKPYTVRYDAVNAMLLNEFLKEHRKVEQLEATVANLVTTVKEQASEMQKVRAQLQLSKPAPPTIASNQ
jgi:trimeric autotransporter adhesin